MTGQDTANVIPFSKLPSSVPSDYMALLTREAADYTVMPGPGGSVTVQPHGDSIGTTVAEAGIEFSQPKTEVKTDDPKLDEPRLAGLGLWSMALATSLTNGVLNPPLLERQLFGQEVMVSTGAESLKSSLKYIREARAALAEEEGVSEGPQPEKPPILTLDPIGLWLGQIKLVANQANRTMGAEDEQVARNMRSTSSSDVQGGLIRLSGLSASQLQPLHPHLSKLADTMSLANLAGGTMVLASAFSLPITAILIKTLDVEHAPEELREPLCSALFTIGTQLARINFERHALNHAPTPEYQQLNSQDPAELAALLKRLTAGIPLPSQMSDTQLDAWLRDLAQKIIESGDAAAYTSSVDSTALSAKLKQLVEDQVAEGTIPPEVASFALTTLLPDLSSGITDIVRGKLKTDLRSSNRVVVGNALERLTTKEGDAPPHTGEAHLHKNYMRALTEALVFMSQIRATIISLEGEYEQRLSAYQLQNIGMQSDIATKQMEAKLNEINTKFQATLKQISNEKFNRIFFPILAIVAAVVAVIIVVASFAFSVATAGAGSFTVGLAAMTAQQLIGFSVGLIVATASMGLAVADAAVTWASEGQKSMWAEFAKAMFGTTDKTKIAIFTAITNLIILIVTAVATLGIGLIAVGAKGITVAAQTGVEMAAIGTEVATEEIIETAKLTGFAAVKAVVKEMLSGASKGASSLAGQQIVACFLAAMFNGGGITMGLQKLMKLMKLDDTKSMILATIITILIMLVITMIASGRVGDMFKSVKDFGKKAGGAVSDFVRAPLKTMTTMITDVRKWANTLTEHLFKSLQNMADRAAAFKENALLALNELKQAPHAILSTAEQIAALTAPHSSAYWMLYNICRKIGEALLTALKYAVQGFRPAAIEEPTAIQIAMGIVAGPGIYTLQVLQDGLKITQSAFQYQLARIQQHLQEQMSELELETSTLTALLDYFGNLGGVNPEALIQALTDSTKNATEQWNDFVKLVDSFFVAAARSVSKATAQGAL